jgi:transforming growth factor-beta-induced protein
MKTFKNLSFKLSFLLSVFIIGFSSCEKDDDPVKESGMSNIVEIASADAQFSILVEALTKANLANTLTQNGTFTVFAPTNEAFEKLFAKLGVSGISDLSSEALTPILLYHVAGVRAMSTDLSTGYVKTLSPAQGDYLSIYVNISSGVSLNSSATVNPANIEASNGVIHVINEVLLPPTVADIAINNPDFSTLTGAVVGANLAATLMDNSATYTVFAPTNTAFAAIGELPSDLTPILLYHVFGESVKAAELKSGIYNSLNADNPQVIVEYFDGIPKINGSVGIAATDIIATNGIVHVVDKVMTPLSGNSIMEIALSSAPEFTSLTAALAKANLASTFLGTNGNFTVFAPTNGAFDQLLSDLEASSLDDLSAEALAPILTYHVIGTEAMSNSLSTGYYPSLSMANNNYMSIFINTDGGVKINGEINVAQADVDADNGVIHIIDKVMTPPTVADLAAFNPDYSSLVSALASENLVTALSDVNGKFTVFAPNNAAFGSKKVASLSEVLLYHVIGDIAYSTDIATGYYESLSMAQGHGVSLFINSEDGVKINGSTMVTKADIVGSNGVIHGINEVLNPPTIVDIAIADDRFESLVAALAKENLVETLQGEGAFTVFAPIDDAFASLLEQLGASDLNDPKVPALTPILLYHVSSGNTRAESLSNGQEITSLDTNAEPVKVAINNGVVTLDTNSKVIITDVQGTNGVIHVIDKVLLPTAR